MEDHEKRIAELEKELAALKAKAAERDAGIPKDRPPWPRYDPTEGFRLPASAARAMAAVVPDVKNPKWDAHAWSETHGPGSPGGFGPPKGGNWDKGPTRVQEKDELKIPPPPWSGWSK